MGGRKRSRKAKHLDATETYNTNMARGGDEAWTQANENLENLRDNASRGVQEKSQRIKVDDEDENQRRVQLMSFNEKLPLPDIEPSFDMQSKIMRVKAAKGEAVIDYRKDIRFNTDRKRVFLEDGKYIFNPHYDPNRHPSKRWRANRHHIDNNDSDIEMQGSSEYPLNGFAKNESDEDDPDEIEYLDHGHKTDSDKADLENYDLEDNNLENDNMGDVNVLDPNSAVFQHISMAIPIRPLPMPEKQSGQSMSPLEYPLSKKDAAMLKEALEILPKKDKMRYRTCFVELICLRKLVYELADEQGMPIEDILGLQDEQSKALEILIKAHADKESLLEQMSRLCIQPKESRVKRKKSRLERMQRRKQAQEKQLHQQMKDRLDELEQQVKNTMLTSTGPAVENGNADQQEDNTNTSVL